MIKYHQDRIDFDTLHQNNIDRIQLEMVPAKSHVLEIGCATGYMTEYLARDKQCRVLGVEPVEAQAEMARQRGLEVITGLIDTPETQDQLIAHTKKHGLFEAIFMSQVIEHIADPAATLRALKGLLNPGGHLIISTCSIVHWKCRLQILFDTRILAPSDILRLIPFIGICLRRATDLFKNFLATQFVYKAQPVHRLK